MPEKILIGAVSGAVVAGIRSKGTLKERAGISIVSALVGWMLGPDIQVGVNEAFDTSIDTMAICFLCGVFSTEVLNGVSAIIKATRGKMGC